MFTITDDDRFLWVRLQINQLCDSRRRSDLLLALNELPSGLRETYECIWTKVQQQSFSRKSLAERALGLIIYSVQALSADAVAEAVTPNGSAYNHHHDTIGVALILDACQGLVVLDPELGVLRPVHFTAQAFLKDYFPEHDSQSRVAENCLRYISNTVTLRAKKRISHDGIIIDFAVYAIMNWPIHVSRSSHNGAVESLEQDFTNNQILHRLWIQNLRILNKRSLGGLSLLLDLLKAYPKYPEASLISACFFGLDNVKSAINCEPLDRSDQY